MDINKIILKNNNLHRTFNKQNKYNIFIQTTSLMLINDCKIDLNNYTKNTEFIVEPNDLIFKISINLFHIIYDSEIIVSIDSTGFRFNKNDLVRGKFVNYNGFYLGDVNDTVRLSYDFINSYLNKN